jgi:hypothetical protein
MTRLALLGFASALLACSGAAPSDLLAPTDGGSHPTSDAARDAEGVDGAGNDDAAAMVPLACPGVGACDLLTQVCCRDARGNDACVAPASCQGLAIPCAGAGDCAAAGHAGWVCCVESATSGGGAADVQCRAPDQCTSSQGRAYVCDGSASSCPTGMSCAQSTHTLTGYSICK